MKKANIWIRGNAPPKLKTEFKAIAGVKFYCPKCGRQISENQTVCDFCDWKKYKITPEV